MAFLLYDLLLIGVSALLILWYLFCRLIGRGGRKGLRERLGLYAPQRLAALAGRRSIWIHAVSVGETRAAIPLIRALRRAWPDHAIVVTNVTETGHAVASGIAEVDLCLFFPIDFSPTIRRVLKTLQPELIVVVETEIWPNLVRCAAEAGIPLALVNGRISDRSYPRYRRLRPLLAPILRRIPLFAMQSALDAERIIDLGADNQSVQIVANLKFDMTAAAATADPLELRRLYGLILDRPLIVAGSTHAGEEEAILAALDSFAPKRPLLVLAPRHPQRCRDVEELLQRRNLAWRRRSTLPDRPEATDAILLVDTLGELLPLYRAADLVFVGGSLVPVGGHNILEAALVGRPVLFGPHMSNFRDIAGAVLAAGAGWQIDDAAGLATALQRLINEPAAARQAGTNGAALIAASSGATARTVALLQGLIRR